MALVSNDIFALQSLLQLSPLYCQSHHVRLRPEKTKLQAFCTSYSEIEAYYAKTVSPITMEGNPVNFVEKAEHVGVLRSSAGNLPHISNRIASHKRALAAVLPVGLARGHRGNPAASIIISNIY